MARLALTFIATVILLALPVAGHRQTTPSTDDALGRFHRAINAYMDLHRRAERSVLALQPTADWTAIARTLEARAAAIRAARPAAAAGDLFDSQASDTIRGRIRAVLRQRGDGLPELEDTDEEIASGTARPAVNGRFPWARGAMMPRTSCTRCRLCPRSCNTASSTGIWCSLTCTPISWSTSCRTLFQIRRQTPGGKSTRGAGRRSHAVIWPHAPMRDHCAQIARIRDSMAPSVAGSAGTSASSSSWISMRSQKLG